MRYPFTFKERIGDVVISEWTGSALIARGPGGDWIIHSLVLKGCRHSDGRPIGEFLLPREHGLFNSIALTLLSTERAAIDAAWFAFTTAAKFPEHALS